MSTQVHESGSLPPSLPSKESPPSYGWITPIVVSLLGAMFMSGGGYLLFTGIGTIPSVISGSTLMIVGGAAVVWGIFSGCCHPKPRVAVKILG